MPNQIIISMSEKYPFGQCQMPEKETSEVLIRKQVITGNKGEYLSKAKHLKKLQVPYSVQIISILEDLQSLQVYYEYVPLKFQIWMKNMSDYLSNNLLKQLYVLTTFLADNKITTVFRPDQLGLDKNYHIKYFIDLENTFYNQFQNISTLKQKYYRQINLFIKSYNSNNDIHTKNPLFHSLNSLRTQNSQFTNSSIRSLPRTLSRNLSFYTFQEDYQTDLNPTESSDSEIASNIKNKNKSALKKGPKQFQFDEKMKYIKQKMYTIKPNKEKTYFNSIQLQKSSKNEEFSIEKGLALKKSVQLSRQMDFQIDKLQDKIQKSQDKKNKSERFKTPKNSESPVEYLDIIKSSSQYVQDFLNVLQDFSESEEQDGAVLQERNQEREQSCGKDLLRTQQSQCQNENQQSKWRARFDAVIQNSKKLIDRMKSPVKSFESVIKT